jgi:thiol-disulfide isomerase/thioredoxin
MLLRQFSPVLIFPLVFSCSSPDLKPSNPRTGPWHVALDLGSAKLPFTFVLEQLPDSALRIHVQNGAEVIVVDDVEHFGDSIAVRMPLFDSEFKGRKDGDGRISGFWFNYLKGPDHKIPFTALAGEFPRFPVASPARMDPTGTWEVHFSPNSAESYPAIGLFEQMNDGRVTGTFLTETGDYRFLEGSVSGDSLRLSCFDGSHAFLFAALWTGDSLKGSFRSGNHWEEPWVAVRNPQFKLRDPDSLTYLREGYDMVDFRFPSIDGGMISINDPPFKGSVRVVQIMGSWCPNCVDETRLLNEIYDKHHADGLQVMSVAFERYQDTVRAMEGLRRFRDVLEVRYPILYGGMAGKGVAAERLPFLNHVMSYPTLIIIDHNGSVRRIRTGIYGPSSGAHYERHKRSLEVFVMNLLQESQQAVQVAK